MLKTSIIVDRDHAGDKGATFDITVHLADHKGEHKVSVVCDKLTGEPTDEALADALQSLAGQLRGA